jgi:hypothetical protein
MEEGHVRKNITWICLDLVGFGSSRRRGDGVINRLRVEGP